MTRRGPRRHLKYLPGFAVFLVRLCCGMDEGQNMRFASSSDETIEGVALVVASMM
jgi:hypothetical protein